MNVMDTRALIERGVISILFVFHGAPEACVCYTGTFMEMNDLKKENQLKYILFLLKGHKFTVKIILAKPQREMSGRGGGGSKRK